MTIKRWSAPELAERIKRGGLRGITDAIGIVERRAVYLLNNPPKTGKIYRRRGVSHQASAPFEAPATDTSRLVNSRRISINPEALRASLIFSAAHGRHLELGTKKMEPRPFARRALLDEKARIGSSIFNGIYNELKK